ncbi:MAG TPA: sugar phosphate isomerase/epimerase [Blastocatellia bacterium]|nr:sugar phosphate isomerase/epimerase [Blastocatellia bacterium]
MSNLMRREFSLSIAAAAVGLGLRPAEKLKPSTVSGINVGVQSYTFRRFDITRMIAALTSVGISSVELWEGHLHPMKAAESDFKTIRRQFDDAGVRVNAYCVNFPVNATDEHLDRGFVGALLLGTNLMTASVKKPIVPRLDLWCQKYKIKLGLHNHWLGDGLYRLAVKDRAQEFEGPQDFLDALKGASRYLSINLDIGHFSAAGHDPLEFIREHHKRIISLHIKDRDSDEKRAHRRLGKGATPVRETIRLLKRLRFRYPANIEYEAEAEDPTEGVRESFDFIKRSVSNG